MLKHFEYNIYCDEQGNLFKQSQYPWLQTS